MPTNNRFAESIKAALREVPPGERETWSEARFRSWLDQLREERPHLFQGLREDPWQAAPVACSGHYGPGARW